MYITDDDAYNEHNSNYCIYEDGIINNTCIDCDSVADVQYMYMNSEDQLNENTINYSIYEYEIINNAYRNGSNDIYVIYTYVIVVGDLPSVL